MDIFNLYCNFDCLDGDILVYIVDYSFVNTISWPGLIYFVLMYKSFCKIVICYLKQTDQEMQVLGLDR